MTDSRATLLPVVEAVFAAFNGKNLAQFRSLYAGDACIVDGIADDRGYISIDAVLTISLRGGNEIVRPGVLTFTLANVGGEWKVDGQAWGRAS